MDILVRQARIIDPASPFHQQSADIFIQNGTIAEIGTVNRSADKEITMEELYASPGWVDGFAQFCDPGLEYCETLQSGAAAAAAGGYTDVMVLPNTQPVLHDKGGIEYIVRRGQSLPVSIHPIGAVTKNAEGKELAEMYDMHASGAVAFSDGTHTIQSAGLMVKALQYLKAIDKTLIQVPGDRSLSGSGLMNEGIVSTRLGLPGLPSIAEELMVARDIELVRYTGSKLHITGISTAKSLALIREAKAAGVAVTCSVTPYHLFFIDEDLEGYDTNLKLTPPLRTPSDRAALQQGIVDGIIDSIATHHLPQHTDGKVVEFEYAQPGMTGLETAFAAVRTSLPGVSLEKIVQIFSSAPRAVFGLPAATLAVGAPASLTLFQPQMEWTPLRFQSRSHNSAFAGKRLTGKPAGIIHKDGLFLNEY